MATMSLALPVSLVCLEELPIDNPDLDCLWTAIILFWDYPLQDPNHSRDCLRPPLRKVTAQTLPLLAV